MSGERVELLKRRAASFLEFGEELLERGVLDIAAFHIQQSCQLRIKASLLRLFGEMPRLHSIRELLGILAMRLDEISLKQESKKLMDFSRGHRDLLMDIDSIYAMARYSVFTYSADHVKSMLRMCEELGKLLEEIEKNVLG